MIKQSDCLLHENSDFNTLGRMYADGEIVNCEYCGIHGGVTVDEGGEYAYIQWADEDPEYVYPD